MRTVSRLRLLLFSFYDYRCRVAVSTISPRRNCVWPIKRKLKTFHGSAITGYAVDAST